MGNPPGAAQPRLHPHDLDRIRRAAAFVAANDTATVLAELLPGLSPAERDAVAAHSRFTHAAVLVFPRSLGDLRALLRAEGLHAGPVTPSTVVRERLARRYGRSADSLEVGILRAPVTAADGSPCEIEVFGLAVPPGSGLDTLAAGERAHDNEAHLALEVTTPDPVVLAGLRATLLDGGRTTADGGGHNAHEDTTVLYFRTGAESGHRRLELNSSGQHPAVLAAHGSTGDRPADRLLHLMTGAWATQAVAVAAELRLADHLDTAPRPTTERLAELTGTHPDRLQRLLRYLTALGVFAPDGTGSHRPTELGRLLRSGADRSLHPLALLYGGPFYRSFGALGYAVRTGRDAFEHTYGAHHFAHFAADPQLADLFDRSMAASTQMFDPIAELVDFTSARVVVDVAGGNGALLSGVLTAHPHLEGVLLERPHVVEAARETLTKAGCADRCRLVPGDFTDGVPAGGDVYLLSRVLHDWDDRQCLAILRRLAEAVPEHAELLVVERLLPADEEAGPSLAVPWDVHMLCNVGGRERTAEHYGRLLAEAGFELTGVAELPLDGALLAARRTR
ncbi:methyltransferase [Streptomyces sp. NRRL B-24484]|uniref:methyltransferase n=1 Tax=Streptomyces sp. NRRL B-24484 TaxID=1463833 RepID=UPI0004C16D14|nr:methyltransferase [Streptomyces sp. NRRL B-24484]